MGRLNKSMADEDATEKNLHEKLGNQLWGPPMDVNHYPLVNGVCGTICLARQQRSERLCFDP